MRARILVGATLVVAAIGFVACNDSTAPDGITYVATMSGANERPTPVTTPATGTATYVLRGNELSYTITVSGLLSNTTGAHIHVGSASVAGPIVVPYTVYAIQNGVVTTGVIDLGKPVAAGANTITGDSLRVLLDNGNAYTNVHTSTSPGGEIRGQIIRQ